MQIYFDFLFYMKTQHTNEYVNLEAFRKRNALLQQDVADILGTSRGYISMVERGDSKLSSQKIDLLFDAAAKNHWDVSDLVPGYSRLQSVMAYLLRKDDSSSNYFTNHLLSSVLEERIKHGEIGINEAFADAIVKQYSEIDKQWLLDGTGEMLLTPKGRTSELALLKEEVRQLKASLLEYQETNMRLLQSLPTLIADEIEKRREQSVSKKYSKS